ncbi:MAG TPA: deoxyhypusine synthase family protein [Candidatus Bathyarchaeia archaeon]|nr:deoxyhypusine synthase family protein [Candidatus Bathyarchaeia archaeon]
MDKKLCGKRNSAKYGDGEGLIPLEPLDLHKIGNFDQMLRAMSQTSFQGRKMGEAADVLEAMVLDKDCFKVLTLAGAMTVGQMGLVICDFIDHFDFSCLVSTGALMLHGLNQSIRGKHYKVPHGVSDRDLYHKGYNRVYDTLELEKNMDRAEEFLQEIWQGVLPDHILSSSEINRRIGEKLSQKMPKDARSPLKSAFLQGIPIYIPSPSDSETGLDYSIYRFEKRLAGEQYAGYDDFLDWEKYSDQVEDAVKSGKRLGIFTIGGGAPRNWAQQVGPYLDIRGVRLGEEHGAFARFHYAVRISTALVQDGGLSGCTYEEGISWGKFVPPEEGGMTAEVFCDATIAWPAIARAVMERLGI